ncbi:VOC family protein [Polymorphum gilvum]|uniref:Glyoxalase protein n=1 Tax=Polymorphum gilvum (strain LMG 25793 / CGMCC 1.9160 / SL003B-26A1) TaxID=991905 RepID=F2J0J5_POLGS|nr:VOC family protein [Polymorphum gilvum]ADZ69663.1 Glyoxalase protein [Polymorphum gilvum SL003B-26A1]
MQGTFIWYELMTSDPAAAADFYGKVVGWQAKDSGMAGFDYTIFSVPGFDMGVAGMMALTPEMRAQSIPPSWIGYVAVDDVDAKASAFAAAGGAILKTPEDIPSIGRFAVVADPHGAALCLFKPSMPNGPMPPEPEHGTPGTFGWRELYAGDGAQSFDFYAGQFGWEKDMAVDMGPMGVYQCFALGGRQIGGIMTKPPEMPVPSWNYYVTVEAIDAAAGRVTAAGGRVMHGPQEVPGGSWIVNCCDPQGAMISLVAPKR